MKELQTALKTIEKETELIEKNIQSFAHHFCGEYVLVFNVSFTSVKIKFITYNEFYGEYSTGYITIEEYLLWRSSEIESGINFQKLIDSGAIRTISSNRLEALK